jgi:Uma2 family endonuclease
MAVRATELPRHLFTIEEFEHMIDVGAFDADKRIELIKGEIVDMTPIGFRHEMCVARLSGLLTRLVGDVALVWPQNNSIRLAENSRPQPDVSLLKLRADYSVERPPTGLDVLLVVEIADTSINYDRTVKGPLYAQAGIPEYWLVNLKASIVEVYSNPAGGNYKQARKVGRGETLPLPGGLQAVVEVSSVFEK